MATGGVPNSAYIIKTVLEELGQISRANGKWTDVRTVSMPDFAAFDANGYLSAEAAKVDDPALLVWLESNGNDETRGQLGGSLAGVLSLVIIGIVKASTGVQMASLNLAEDVKSVMLYNPGRIYPGETDGNSYGMTTSMADSFNFGVSSGQATRGIGVFTSRWSIVYRFTNPGG